MASAVRDRNGSLVLDPGTRVGSYIVGSRLVDGGLGTLFRASLGEEDWVLKAFRHDPSWSDEEKLECHAYFEEECDVHPQLSHPHIVSAGLSFLHDGERFLPTRFAPAGTLSRWLEKSAQRPSVAVVVRVLREVGSALQYLSYLGFVHRDVSPANIFVDQRDRTLLGDFGFVTRVRTDSACHATNRSMSYGVGRWAYGAPELFDGLDRFYDERVDTYSLGVVGIVLLTGRPPRRWTPRRHRPEVPVPLDDLLWRMVDDGPDMRPCWAEVLQVLERIRA
jgi:serine/threonine protein kinase